jgi:RNA polymerase sigma-70 factor (ECF subfamily)
MSKVFAFSTRARRRGFQCCAARLISGNGWFGNESRPKAPVDKHNGEGLVEEKMESRYGAVPSPPQMVTSINEASLLATANSGETAALDTPCQAHAEKLFRTVHRISRNREDAEDAVQGSLLGAFLHRKSFGGRTTFSTWLTHIGINSAPMILEKKGNSSERSAHGAGVDETLWEVPDAAPHPEIRCAERERQRFLRDAFAGLLPRLRRTLEFRTLQDHSLRDTAAPIGVLVAAAKARLFHAKAALHRSKVRKINVHLF